MTTELMTPDSPENPVKVGIDVQRLVREACNQAIRERRAYGKIHPEAHQDWAENQRTGGARLARKILRIISANGKDHT